MAGPRISDKRSWTQNLYLMMRKEVPKRDIREENLPALMEKLSSLTSVERDILERYVGVRGKRETSEAIAKSYGASNGWVKYTIGGIALELNQRKVQDLFKD